MKWLAAMVAMLLAAPSCEDSSSPTSSGSPGAPVLVLTDATFDAEVLKSDQPVLVDFWASWCPPCRAISPVVEELAAEYQGRAKVGKVDVDANTKLARQYSITSIPALLVFHKGEVKGKFVGVTSKKRLAAALEQALQ